jgi:selenium metabolism protein YedF
MLTLDARGLACPAPVLLVKDCLDKENRESLTVLVDNEASKENVGRFLATHGYLVMTSVDNSDFRLLAKQKEGGKERVEEEVPQKGATDKAELEKVLVLVTSDQLGRGDGVLSAKLMINFIKTLAEMAENLWQLVFINAGVKLTVTTSPVLTELQKYENAGVIVLACGTCLEHFQLTQEKQVGTTTNMLDIVTAMQLADKVITVG